MFLKYGRLSMFLIGITGNLLAVSEDLMDCLPSVITKNKLVKYW